MYYRSDQALIHCTFPGVWENSEPWGLFEGGEKKSAGLKIFPGGMAEQVELGGTPEREPIKLARKWSDVLIGVFKTLDAIVGEGEAVVSVQPLNKSKVPVGELLTFNCILLELKRPMYKAGPSEVSELELTLGPQGALG